MSHAEYETIFELFFDDGKLTDVQARKADGIEMLTAKDQKEALKVVERMRTRLLKNGWSFSS